MDDKYIDKEKLRPVEFKGFSKLQTGYFHLWYKSVDNTGNEDVYALVEKEDGKMIDVASTNIKFKDRVEFEV